MSGVFIGLGSNLGSPVENLLVALKLLALTDGIKVKQVSKFYQNPPMGPQDQPDYVNAVVQVETTLKPHVLLKQLFMIEQHMGRLRTLKWGPRVIDLDLLIYHDTIINDIELILPHPGIRDRSFVACLLYEIMPDLHLPDGTSLKSIVAQCDVSNLMLIELVGVTE